MIKPGYKRLGDYIEPMDERNSNLSVKLSQGICNNKYFITPRQVAENSANDKIVRTGQFAYNRATTRNGDKISIAYREGPDCTVSSAYQIFRIKDENKLNPHYLWMWFSRPEFDRYARFKSRGSAHEFFEWDEMCEVYLPIPDIHVQRQIVAEYQAIENRIHCNEQLISKLETTADTIFKNLFIDSIDVKHLPTGWQYSKLGDYCSQLYRGITPSYEDDSPELVLGQTCVRNNRVSLSNARHHILKGKTVKKVTTWDILINSTGEGSLGRVGIVYFPDNNVSFDSHITLVRSDNPLYQIYLGRNLLLRQSEIENMAIGSTGQTELPRESVANIDLVIPTENVLSAFNQQIKSIMQYVYSLAEENKLLGELLILLRMRVASL